MLVVVLKQKNDNLYYYRYISKMASVLCWAGWDDQLNIGTNAHWDYAMKIGCSANSSAHACIFKIGGQTAGPVVLKIGTNTHWDIR
jgi:hypothetical protein